MKKLMIILIMLMLFCKTDALAIDYNDILDYADEYNLSEYYEIENDVFGDFNVKEIQKSLIKGEAFDSISIINKIKNVVFSEAKAYIKMFSLLIVCALILSIYESIRGGSVSEISELVGYCVFAGITCSLFNDITTPVIETVEYMCVTAKAFFGVLIGIIGVRGGVVSSALLNSSLFVMASLFLDLIKNIIIPLIISSAVLSVADNFSKKINVSKFADTLKNAAKWLLVFIMSLYTGIYGIYGIVGSSIDSTVKKAARLAASTAIPIVGGAVADSMETIATLLKSVSNIIGVSGIIIIIVYAALPLIKLLVLTWCMKLCSALIQPFANNSLVKLTTDLSSCTSYMFAVVVACCIILSGCIGIIMLTGNFIT